jgi:transcriptional regulator with XRE-family HTH domain
MKLRIGERVALIRRARGLTQRELARLMGCSQQLVSKWEHNRPRWRYRDRLAELLGVRRWWLDFGVRRNWCRAAGRLSRSLPFEERLELAVQVDTPRWALEKLARSRDRTLRAAARRTLSLVQPAGPSVRRGNGKES